MTSIDKFLKNIQNRRLIIYGTGNTGKKLLERLNEKINIYACTSGDGKSNTIGSLPYISYENINLETDFLIVSSVYYEEIRKKLYMDGLKPFVHYCRDIMFEKIFDSALENKKIAVSIGQCEIKFIAEALEQINTFSKEYNVFYFDERTVCLHGNYIKMEEVEECKEVIGVCTLLFLPAVITKEAREGLDFYIKKCNPGIEIVRIPLFNMDIYWPQDMENERTVSKYYVTKAGEKLKAYANRDSLVEQLVDSGKSAEYIMNRVVDLDCFSLQILKKNFDKTMKRIRLVDRISDIAISDFVEREYNKKKLFCDRGHFSEELLSEYIHRILEYLSMSYSSEEVSGVRFLKLFATVNEFPIYPCVIDKLQLSWKDSQIFRMNLYDGIQKVTFEQYMQYLVQYYIEAKKVIQFSAFNLENRWEDA